METAIGSYLGDGSVVTGFVAFCTYMTPEGEQGSMFICPEDQLNTVNVGLLRAATIIVEETVRVQWRRDVGDD